MFPRATLPAFFSVLLSASLLDADTRDSQTPHPSAATADPIHEKVTLAEIVIAGSLPEGPRSPDLFSSLRESLDDVLGRIDKAAQDPAISGMVVRLHNPEIGWGKLNELRQAILRFRVGGKKAYAILQLAVLNDYLIATACDEIVMPPSGMLMLAGLSAEVTFFKGLLEKLGIEADLMTVGDYKGSSEPFLRTQLSEPQRAQMNAVLDDYWEQLVQHVADGRRLECPRVKEILDGGPFTPGQAEQLGLIDALLYDDECPARWQRQLCAKQLEIDRTYGRRRADLDFVGLAGLVKMVNLLFGIDTIAVPTGGPKIAVVYATGVIVPGDALGGLLSGKVMGAETIVEAIRSADEDPQVSAIVMRVDSRGGSAMASDLIWRAVTRTTKPFIASMGDTAASGGYYIAMGADRIFVEPGTLTGSIGVIGGKVALRGLYDKIGISTETLRRGKNAGAFSLDDRFSDSQRQAVLEMMKDTYAQFISKAAEGRRMDPAKLEALAGGRIWTGRMAVLSGLADQMGTLRDALAEAKSMAGLKPDDDVELLPLPRPKSLLEQWLAMRRGGERHSAEAAAEIARSLAPLLPAGLTQDGAVLAFVFRSPVVALPAFHVRLR